MNNLQFKRSHIRWTIIIMLFIVSSLNYADRAAISIGAPSMQNELGISAVAVGYIF